MTSKPPPQMFHHLGLKRKTLAAQTARLIDEFGEMVASTVWGHTSGDADAPQGLLRHWGRTVDVVETRRLLEECYQGSDNLKSTHDGAAPTPAKPVCSW